MGVREGYKQTEVGVIPEQWLSTIVGNISEVRTGPFGAQLHESDYVLDGTPIITVEHLGERGVDCSNLPPQVSDLDKRRLSNYVLTEGDIVFSRVGSIDRNALIREEQEGWLFSGRLLRVRPLTEVYAEYLSHQFHTSDFKSRVREVAVGQTMASINTAILKSIAVSLPPLPEQKAIATALSDTDELIAGLEALVAKKRAIKQGAMQQLLTGRKRLPGFTGEWEEKRLGEVLRVRHGRSQHAVSHPEGQFPIFASGGEIGRATEFLYDRPSVLIGRKGTIDEPRYAEAPFWTVDTLFYTEISAGYNAKFVFFVFCTINWLNYNEASGVPSLNARVIESIKVSVPSQSEQQAIAAVLSDMDAEIESLQTQLGKTRALKQGMMQELLTGRIRLVEPVKGAE